MNSQERTQDMSKIKSEPKTENSVQRSCIDKIEHKRQNILWWQTVIYRDNISMQPLTRVNGAAQLCCHLPPSVLRVSRLKSQFMYKLQRQINNVLMSCLQLQNFV